MFSPSASGYLAGCLLLLAAAACGSSSPGGSGGNGSGSGSGGSGSGSGSGGSGSGSGSGGSGSGGTLSQQVVWPVSAQANVLGNNLQIDVDNIYGYATPGDTPLADVEALAKTVNDTITSLSTSACASDPKAADAASASQALLAFAQGLPSGGGSSSMLTAQESEEEQLSSALRSAITASPCISQLTPANGSTTPVVGSDLSSAVALTGAAAGTNASNVEIPVGAAKPYPAIAVTNLSADSLSFSSVTIAYVDGSTRSIGFGSYPGDGTSTLMSGAADLPSSASLVVDVDPRAIQSVTLVGASLGCPEPPGGGDGGGDASCSGSVKIVGMAAGNGLSP